MEKNDQFLLVIGATTRQITLNISLKIHISPKKGPFQQEMSSSIGKQTIGFRGGVFFEKTLQET